MIRAETQYRHVAFFAMTGGMKSPADLRERFERSGKSQVSLAKHLGKSKDSINRLLLGRRELKGDEYERAVEFLEGGPREPEPAYQQINVYGYAAAGAEDRIAIADDRVLERIEVPLGLARGEIFGVRIAGDSMEPRLYSGEVVIVSRGVQPSRFGDCVVELRDNSALVKQYRGQKDGFVFLYQYNPEGEVKLPATQVRAMHAVKYRL